MNGPRRQHGQVLILLGAWLFFFGGATSALIVFDRSPKETKKVIERVVADQGRREKIVSLIKQWESGQKKLDKRVNSDRKDLLDLLKHKDATRAEAEVITAKLDETFAQMDKNFLDLRFAVKQRVSSKEWVPIVARPAAYGSQALPAAPGPADGAH